MKNSEIHAGLCDAEMRRGCGRTLKKAHYNYGLNALTRAIFEYEKVKAEMERRIEDIVTCTGVMKMVEGRGWIVHDVSDEIEDYRPETYCPFVGTPKEYKERFGG